MFGAETPAIRTVGCACGLLMVVVGLSNCAETAVGADGPLLGCAEGSEPDVVGAPIVNVGAALSAASLVVDVDDDNGLEDAREDDDDEGGTEL